MKNLQDLVHEMENLTLEQLERLHEFIATRPYKEAGREPSPQEVQEVYDELKRIVAEPRPVEGDALARIEAMMKEKGEDAPLN